MFLPTTRKELQLLGWHRPDIILVTGDSYIDSPFTGIALLGKFLVREGFRIGIIAQPDITSDKDITRLGEPALFWGVTSGAVDSMVSNYTATKKRRQRDDYTPGGINNRRPDRAVIAYTNLIRQHFKKTRPIVLGGIEASLRRICHYDFWSDNIRRSILFDAKADYLVYGMGEKTTLTLAREFKSALQKQEIEKNRKTGKPPSSSLDENTLKKIKGLSYISKNPPENYVELPSFDRVKKDKKQFIQSFHTFYLNNDPITAKGLFQQHDARFLVQNPPSPSPDTGTMDRIYDLHFERAHHPYYERFGSVKALDTIRFSIQTHRGCYGECNFCAIAVHEGRTVSWRSEESILKEVKSMISHRDFKGIIADAGGPTANMYGFECEKKLKKGACPDKRCLFPEPCNSLLPNHSRQIALLSKIKKTKGVKKVFVASGVRYDLIFADQKNGSSYLEAIVRDHVSGQMKVAPEHTEDSVLSLMGKPGTEALLKFKKHFDKLSSKIGKKQFLTYYLIAAHPGCTMNDMKRLKTFTRDKLQITPEQVQVFTPTPSTYASLMYCTGVNPFSGKPLFVERTIPGKEKQKWIVTGSDKDQQNKKWSGKKTRFSKPFRKGGRKG